MIKVSQPRILENAINEIPAQQYLSDSQKRPYILNTKIYTYALAITISVIIISFTVFVGQLSDEAIGAISDFIDKIGFIDLRLSRQFIQDIRFPSLIAQVIVYSNLIFIFYAFRDSLVEDKNLDGSHYKESFAISYAIHLLILLVLLINVFIAFKPKPMVKVSTIEYIPKQIKSKKPPPPETKRKSPEQSIDQGKTDPKKKVEPVKKKQANKPQVPKEKVKAGEKSKPTRRPKPSPKPQLKGAKGGSASKDTPNPMPRPKAPSGGSGGVKAPGPKIANPKSMGGSSAPSSSALNALNSLSGPKGTGGGRGAFTPSMKTGGGYGGGGSPSGGGAPQPKNYGYSRGSGGGVGGGQGSGGGGDRNLSDPIAAENIGSGDGGSGGQDLIDRLGDVKAPDDIDVSLGGGGGGGNPGKNKYSDRPPSTASIPDIAFGPYMARIQEMIKRKWTPPRGSESKRIVVKFSISRSGQVTNVKVVNSNGGTDANNAALAAIRNASPFPQLPVGSGPSVDIEFTFDYNVFKRGRF
jgi:TonB family protein